MSVRVLLHGMAAACALAVAVPSLAQEAAALRVSSTFPVNGINSYYAYGVSERLTVFAEDGEFHPWLLESIEPVDETRWRLTLRDGVRFHNGNVLDAEALGRLIAHRLEHASAARGVFPEDVRFEVTGPLEITFTTDRPFPQLPGLLARREVFPVYDVASVPEGADAVADIDSFSHTGPYSVVETTPDRLTLSRNDDYWQGAPAMEAVEAHFIREASAGVLAVQNGEIDIALWMPLAVKAVVDATPGIHFNADTPHTSSYTAFLNVADGPFEDRRVALAFNKAIDYETIAEQVFDGVFGVADSFYAPIHPWAVANQATDREAAGALLDEAGWEMGADGLRYRDGEPLVIRAISSGGLADMATVSTFLQADLRGLGIDYQFQPVDDTADATRQFDWDVALFSEATGGNGVPEEFLRRALTPGGRANYGGYDNGRVTEIADRLHEAVDPAERNALLAEVQEILINEDPAIFLLAINRMAAVVNEGYAHYQPGFYFRFVDWQTQPGQ